MRRAAAAEKLTALEHLHELWLRLMGSVAIMFVGGAAAYVFRLQIIHFLQRPLGEQLYYTSPMGSFQFIMQVCLLCGIVLALPILMYNILRFIEPAFEKNFSRRFVLLVLGSSLTLTAVGVAFGYYLTLPFALNFFGSIGGSSLHPLISANQYFSFVLGYLATFAIVFQLPMLLLFINYITPFKPGGLTKWRRYVYVGAFAVSLIMPSSPDPLSQVSLAIPIIALYELSIALVWAVNRKKHRPTKTKAPLTEEQRSEQPTAFAAPALQAATAAAASTGSFDDLFGEEVEPFSIAREQAVAGVESQQPVVSSTPIIAAPRTLPGRHAQRRNYQQPVARRVYSAENQPLPSRTRLISDIL